MTLSIEKLLKKPITRVLLLVIPCLLLYFRVLYYGFSAMDEQWMILKSTAFLEKWSSCLTAFSKTSTHVYYRPLFTISLIFDYHLGKLSPGLYHFSNLVWHCITILLLYQFLLLFRIKQVTAYLFCLLFSVHPILLHTVAWIPGRNDSMLAVFCLAAFIYLMKYLNTPSTKLLLYHVLFFLCALFTKESAIVLPVIFVAQVLLFGDTNKRRAFKLVGCYLLLTITWFVLRNAVVVPASSITALPTPQLKTALLAALLYIGKTIYPFQQSVFPLLRDSNWVPGALTLLVLSGLCILPGLKDKKVASFGVLIFLVLIAVPLWYGATSGSGEHYEQRLYGSMLGLILFLTQLNFDQNSERFHKALLLLVVIYVFKTSVRLPIYQSEESFADAGVQEAPSYYLFHLQKADLLSKRNEFNTAVQSYDKALACRPNLAEALNNRAYALLKMGQYSEAIAGYSAAIEHSRNNKLYYKGRCMAYYQSNNIRAAVKDFMQLKECCPELISPSFETKITTRYNAEISAVQKLLKEQPNNPLLYADLANLYIAIKMDKEAGLCLQKANELGTRSKR